MPKDNTLYLKLVPLNNRKHLSLRVKEQVNFSFTKNCNAAILTTAEFEKASKIYPVLFVRDGDDIVPCALFGIEQGQNLFLKWNHQWDASYIPASIRRYPFSLVKVVHEQKKDHIVCIDEASPLTGKQGEYSLFQKNGKQSQYLREKIQFLQEYQVEYEHTQQFVNALRKLELLEPMSANISLVNGETLSITGFYTIDKNKFRNLNKEHYFELIQNDDMKLIYEHFSSLDNFASLIDKIAEKKMISGQVKKIRKTHEKKSSTDSNRCVRQPAEKKRQEKIKDVVQG